MGFPSQRRSAFALRALGVATATALAVSVAACGGDAAAGGETPAAPAATTPATTAVTYTPPPAGPLSQGDIVTPGKKTPANVKAALAAGRPVVLAFLFGKARDEADVRKAVATVRRSAAGGSVAFFVYDVSTRSGFGDLTTRVAVTETPAVVVLGRDNRVVNVWTGLTDAEMLAESVATAKQSSPR